jgi:hypothetical protein
MTPEQAQSMIDLQTAANQYLSDSLTIHQNGFQVGLWEGWLLQAIFLVALFTAIILMGLLRK